MFTNVFYEIAMLLAVAGALGAMALWLRQPLIVAFIAVGILVGPSVLGWVSANDTVDLLAKLGIALLLFVVGLRLDLHLIRTMGSVALATGIGQVLFTAIFGFLIVRVMGFPSIVALYVAIALTFSSTIIIVKLLSDKREIDSLHGRIAVGLLIVQDIAVILMMIGLTAFGVSAGSGSPIRDLIVVLLYGAGFIGLIAFVMRYILPGLMKRLARSQELLLLFAIMWAVCIATLGDYLGLSKEVGAFLAGVSLASTPFRDIIGARLVSLRDFLLLFFFIDLGAQVDLSLLHAQLGPALVLSLFVLVGNPLIVLIIMGFMGYHRRTGFLVGLTVAQISEFSLVLTALGVSLNHIGTETLGLVTMVGLITIGLSTYIITYSHPLYDRLSTFLRIFERKRPYREQQLDEGANGRRHLPDVIIFGLGRYGGNIAEVLRTKGINVLGVDFNPEIVEAWRRRGLSAAYGDAEDPEFPGTLPLVQARWVVSTLPSRATNITLLQALRNKGYAGRVALTAHNEKDFSVLGRSGSDKVFLPFLDASKEAAEFLTSETVRSDRPSQ